MERLCGREQPERTGARVAPLRRTDECVRPYTNFFFSRDLERIKSGSS